MPIEPEPPELSSAPLEEAVVANTVAAHATGSSDHHGPHHTHCENCGTALAGPFCHKCGQHDFEFHRSFWHVFLDALENFFHFDAKLFRNIVTLLFRPGRLTADFNSGKRASQMPPFRLYLFVSILFFFISFVGAHPGSDLDLTSPSSPGQRAAVRRALDDALQDIGKETGDPALRSSKERAIRRLQELSGKPNAKPLDLTELPKLIAKEMEKPETVPSADVSSAPPDGGTSPAAPEPPPGRKNAGGGINLDGDDNTESDFERFLNEKGRYAFEHQREMVESFIHALPKMLLLCLPFFALYTRVLFRKSGQVYLQHLVLALHFHTFIFLWVLARNGWGFLAGFASIGLKGWVQFGCNLWMVLYPFLMVRHLFANSWSKTIVKTGLLALGYTLTLGLGFVVTAIILFLLL